MALDEEITLLFENYLDGLLSEAERAAFELRLVEDATFAANFETYKEISSYLTNQFSEERSLLKKQLEEASNAFTSEETPIPSAPKVIKFKPWQLGIAASIAVLLGVFFFQSGGLQQSDYIFADTISLTERGNSAATFNQAEENFNNKDYTAAIGNFESILQSEPTNTEIIFYKAVAHDALNDYKVSDELFSSLSQGSSAFKNKATYYHAISLWKQGNIERCKALLNDIPATAPEFKQAKKLLKKL